MTDVDLATYWQNRYAERKQVWSGNANAALVATVTGLPPGRALDLGCGEGGDSVWLAEQGWTVTGVDIAENAVRRGQTLAEQRGIAPERITWVVAELSEWEPADSFELVSACFLHSPLEFPRAEVLRRAASHIVRGGHLLIVGHAAPPPWSAHDHRDHRYLPPDEELAELGLDGEAWETVVAEVRHRAATGPDGQPAELDDTVVLLRRR
jgi:SAM-dependent methyltransferase